MLENKVLIMKYLNDKLASEFTNMNSDMNKIDSEYTKMRSYMNEIRIIPTQMMIKKQYSSSDKMDSPKAQDPSTAVPDNKKASLLQGVN